MINKRTYLLLATVLLFVNFIGWSWRIDRNRYLQKRGFYGAIVDDDNECEDVYRGNDPCAFVREHCRDNSGIINYLPFYFCQGSLVARFLAFGAILLWLGFLFSFVGIAASDFLCPNLNTIASSLSLSESMAGVTFLAFGNGSPDVFSTFTAMKAHSGSLAIGELIGAASFITSVIAGCMAAIQPFRVNPAPFIRDLCFFVGALLFTMWIVWDMKIYLWEGIFLILFYVGYVTTVVVGSWWGQRRKAQQQLVQTARDEYSDDAAREETSRLLASNPSYCDEEEPPHVSDDDPSLISSGRAQRIAVRLPPLDMSGLETHSYLHSATPRPGFRPSLFSAIEFRDVVQSLRRVHMPDDTLLRADRGHSRWPQRSRSTPPMSRQLSPLEHSVPRHSQSQPVELRQSDQDSTLPPIPIAGDDSQVPTTAYSRSPTDETTPPDLLRPANLGQAPQTPTIIVSTADVDVPSVASYSSLQQQPEPSKKDEILRVLFPSLHGWSKKSAFAKTASVVAVPMILLLTLTLPVVDDDKMQQLEYQEEFGPENDDDDEDDTADSELQKPPQWLTATQLFCAPTYITFIFYVNDTLSPIFILYGVVFGVAGMAASLLLGLDSKSPHYKVLCFVGFAIAMVHVYIIASEVVGVFQALGLILGLSDAILGLTIFAAGNSLGDLVANITIAKMGFPVMGFSACFGSPMLNILLGIGISATYITSLTNEPYSITLAPTILVSSAGLLLVLLSSLILVPLNNFWITRRLGVCWIAIYLTCTLINICIEVTRSR